MEKAQEGVWLLVISLSYPRQTLPNMCVQWPLRARNACAKAPLARRDFPAIPYSLDRSFSSMLTSLVNRGYTANSQVHRLLTFYTCGHFL